MDGPLTRFIERKRWQEEYGASAKALATAKPSPAVKAEPSEPPQDQLSETLALLEKRESNSTDVLYNVHGIILTRNMRKVSPEQLVRAKQIIAMPRPDYKFLEEALFTSEDLFITASAEWACSRDGEVTIIPFARDEKSAPVNVSTGVAEGIPAPDLSRDFVRANSNDPLPDINRNIAMHNARVQRMKDQISGARNPERAIGGLPYEYKLEPLQTDSRGVNHFMDDLGGQH